MKKKPNWFEPYTRWWKQVVLSIIIVPALAMSWKHVQVLWASPDKLEHVEKKVMSQDEVQTQLSKLIVEQEARLDKSEAVQEVQIDALKGQLELIAQLKKDKK